jgi:dienelactone hydrolase
MTDLQARYDRARALAPELLVPAILNRRVMPTWTGEGDAFWYRRQVDGQTTEAVLVDAISRSRTVVADDDPRLVPAAARPVGVLSADGKAEAFRRDAQLWLRDLATGDETQLSEDGEEHWEWGALPDNIMLRIPLRRAGIDLAPAATAFSPSGRFLVTARLDERGVAAYPHIEHVPATGARPVVHPIRVQLEEDADIGDLQLAIHDLGSGKRVLAAVPPDAVVSLFSSGPAVLAFSSDESTLYVFAHRMGARTGRLLAIDTATGTARTVVEETEERCYEPNTFLYSLPLVRVLPERGELLWFSMRDGWGHLYRYDLTTGELLNQVTRGQLVVSDLLRVDEARGELLLLAGSGQDGHNPYWRKAYRVSLDGTEQVLLTPEPLDHSIPAPTPQFFDLIFGARIPKFEPISPSGDLIVDCMSTPSEPPVTVVRSTRTGDVLVELERADVSALLDAGYIPPQQFRVEVDGVDVWGVLTLPPDATADAPVPVIDLMYAGFQMRTQPTCYLGDVASAQGSGAAAYAALGFATVCLDARGTSGRHRDFRRYGQGRPHEVDPLADHVAATRALAAQVPQIDISRVGVTGHSFGGYNSVRALLLHNEFYSAAVSSAGVHVPEKNAKDSWGWQVGLDADHSSDSYQALGNLHLVDRLRGALLIQHGMLDENATVDHALALADALIRAGKRFDLKLWPNADHYTQSPYITMTTWDHFVRHLHGIEPPVDFSPATSGARP